MMRLWRKRGQRKTEWREATADEEARFNEAFDAMDDAFAEMDKAFSLMGRAFDRIRRH